MKKIFLLQLLFTLLLISCDFTAKDPIVGVYSYMDEDQLVFTKDGYVFAVGDDFLLKYSKLRDKYVVSDLIDDETLDFVTYDSDFEEIKIESNNYSLTKINELDTSVFRDNKLFYDNENDEYLFLSSSGIVLLNDSSHMYYYDYDKKNQKVSIHTDKKSYQLSYDSKKETLIGKIDSSKHIYNKCLFYNSPSKLSLIEKQYTYNSRYNDSTPEVFLSKTGLAVFDNKICPYWIDTQESKFNFYLKGTMMSADIDEEEMSLNDGRLLKNINHVTNEIEYYKPKTKNNDRNFTISPKNTSHNLNKKFNKGDFLILQENLNLRTSPNSSGSIISTMESGSLVKILEVGSEDIIYDDETYEGYSSITSDWYFVIVVDGLEKGTDKHYFSEDSRENQIDYKLNKFKYIIESNGWRTGTDTVAGWCFGGYLSNSISYSEKYYDKYNRLKEVNSEVWEENYVYNSDTGNKEYFYGNARWEYNLWGVRHNYFYDSLGRLIREENTDTRPYEGLGVGPYNDLYNHDYIRNYYYDDNGNLIQTVTNYENDEYFLDLFAITNPIVIDRYYYENNLLVKFEDANYDGEIKTYEYIYEFKDNKITKRIEKLYSEITNTVYYDEDGEIIEENNKLDEEFYYYEYENTGYGGYKEKIMEKIKNNYVAVPEYS